MRTTRKTDPKISLTFEKVIVHKKGCSKYKTVFNFEMIAAGVD